MTPATDEAVLTALDRRLVRGVAVANVAVISVLATAAWVVWAGFPSAASTVRPTHACILLIIRGGAVLCLTLGCGLVAIGIWRAARRFLGVPRAGTEAIRVTGIVSAALLQALILAHFDDTPVDARGITALWVAASLGYLVSILVARLAARLLVGYRRSDEQRRVEMLRAAEAAAELEAEEFRVRRMLADRLHGSVQNRLVVAAAMLDNMAAELESHGDGERAERLREVADSLDTLASEDVRTVSHALFPTEANLDTFDAVRVLLSRLPTSVATALDLGPGLHAEGTGAAIPVPLRLVVVYAVEEALTNAVKHGARSVRVHADLAADSGTASLYVQVDDDGCGLADPEPTLHGLERHRSRVAARGGHLHLEPSPEGGARLSITLPLNLNA